MRTDRDDTNQVDPAAAQFLHRLDTGHDDVDGSQVGNAGVTDDAIVPGDGMQPTPSLDAYRQTGDPANLPDDLREIYNAGVSQGSTGREAAVRGMNQAFRTAAATRETAADQMTDALLYGADAIPAPQGQQLGDQIYRPPEGPRLPPGFKSPYEGFTPGQEPPRDDSTDDALMESMEKRNLYHNAMMQIPLYEQMHQTRAAAAYREIRSGAEEVVNDPRYTPEVGLIVKHLASTNETMRRNLSDPMGRQMLLDRAVEIAKRNAQAQQQAQRVQSAPSRRDLPTRPEGSASNGQPAVQPKASPHDIAMAAIRDFPAMERARQGR